MSKDVLNPRRPPSGKKVIPVVRLDGAIGMRSGAGRALSATAIEPALQAAFAMSGAPAVVLAINSPGGSPVQSSLIVKRIRALSEKHKKPVLAVVEDMAASGGYMLACAADEIIADPSSIVGSIGVIGGGFGFSDLIARYGVERRVLTAGVHKARNDPFAPQKPEDVARLKDIMGQLHEEFIALVKARRGAKLKEHPTLFEGEIFTAREALDSGLIDGLGDLHGEIARRFGAKAKPKMFSLARPTLLQRLFGGAAAAITESVFDTMDERDLRARFGAAA
jgi:signal peptide peptidase SppA